MSEKNVKLKIANALKFNPDQDAAPQLIAKGLGLIAENIINRIIKIDERNK